jgi:hypothetical protein
MPHHIGRAGGKTDAARCDAAVSGRHIPMLAAESVMRYILKTLTVSRWKSSRRKKAALQKIRKD